jgi:hypothetical protein
MSYLNPLRLHFAGRFQASVSTVNNDPVHYDNAQFKPEYQELQTRGALNGWWNPRGDANWRLIGCQVTAAHMPDGSAAAQDDPIMSYLVADSDRQVAAKLVDMDPEQQLVSTIWGMEVRIATAAGETLLRGRYVPAAFMDIWDRAASGGGDVGAGAMYQSVLTDLEWGDLSASRFLQELRAAASDGLLSIKFNTDGYNMTFTSPEFTRGRIVGTIGPATAAEPQHFVLGRHLMTTGLPSGNFFAPAGKINFCVATVNEQLGKIYLDLGNALPTTKPGGTPAKLGSLAVVCEAQPMTAGGFVERLKIGEIPQALYTNPQWYADTAGVVELPADRTLTSAELKMIANNPLMILLPDASAHPTIAISEPPTGGYVRADQYVFRLSPGEQANVKLYATQYGQPYADAGVIVFFDPNQLQPGSPLGPAPVVGTPTEALAFPSRVITDANGMATLPLTAADPGNPRGYIDGQMYGVRPVLEDTIFIPGGSYPFNQWEFISVLVWTEFQPDEPPTWYGSMEPIFTQYANLYPVMDRFLNMADYDSVCEHQRLLLLAFGLDADDPNTMPVTRDLSTAKRKAILRWLSMPGPDGKPLKGTPPTNMLRAPAPTAPHAEQAAPHEIPQGGKAAAASRRLGLRLVRS